MKSLQKVTINPANAILVIVDMQNDFCRAEGKWFTGISARVMPGVISAVNDLVKRARGARIPDIYIQSIPESSSEKPLDNPWGIQIIDEIKPGERDTVIRKSSHDAFYQTDLDRVLTKLVPEPALCQAMVTGGAVNVCAYHAILGFHVRNYWTVVPVDGVYYSREDGKELALEMLSWRAYRNVFFSRTDLIEVSEVPAAGRPGLIPG